MPIPTEGGAYIVAYDNFGYFPALVAAAALLTDYILTVSVSVSSGVAQIVSAYPELLNYRVPISVLCVAFIMIINLRGVREAGAAFAVPSYLFIVMMLIPIGTGLFRLVTGSLPDVQNPPEIEHFGQALSGITAFLLLHAFSSGTSALNRCGGDLERHHSLQRAAQPQRGNHPDLDGSHPGFVVYGNLFPDRADRARCPLKQKLSFHNWRGPIFNGQGILYLLVIVATTVILILAANTAFAGFPRLSAAGRRWIHAASADLSRQPPGVFLWDCLTGSHGRRILIIVFQASVTRLIPLYAIGVFMSFTLAQAGMARRWWRAGKLNPKDSNKAGQPQDVTNCDTKKAGSSKCSAMDSERCVLPLFCWSLL